MARPQSIQTSIAIMRLSHPGSSIRSNDAASEAAGGSSNLGLPAPQGKPDMRETATLDSAESGRAAALKPGSIRRAVSLGAAIGVLVALGAPVRAEGTLQAGPLSSASRPVVESFFVIAESAASDGGGALSIKFDGLKSAIVVGKPAATPPPDDTEANAGAVSVPLPPAVLLFATGLGALGYLGGRRIGAWRRRGAWGRRGGAAAPLRPPTCRTRRHLRERLRQAAEELELAPQQNERPGPADPSNGGGRQRPRVTDPYSLSVRLRFEELSRVLLEEPNVSAGRSFGRACLKHSKKAFLVCDERVLAFRVGTERAAALVASLAQAEPWNPKQGRQPKWSWLAHPVEDFEALVTLTAAAYEHSAAASSAPVTDSDEEDYAGRLPAPSEQAEPLYAAASAETAAA